MYLHVNLDTIMKYLGLELNLSVGLCGKGVGFGFFFKSVTGFVLGEKGNDLSLVFRRLSTASL